MNRGVLILALLCPTLLLGVLALCPSAEPPLDAAPEQGALRHQLAQRLERGETDEEDPLLSRYQGFLAAESSLTVPTDPGLASLQLLFDEREQLRQQSFTPAEQGQLFAEDRLMEQWTLRRKALAEADDADREALGEELALWLAEQPQWFREAEANGRLLGDLQRLEQISPAERAPCCWSNWDRRRWIGCASWRRASKGSNSSWRVIWRNSSHCDPGIVPNSNGRSWRAGSIPDSGGG